MKHALRMIGYGVGGLAVTAALSLGAFALAGSDISQPIQPVGFAAIESPRATKPPAEESDRPRHDRSPKASPSGSDDHSGTSGTSSGTSVNSGPGSSSDGSSSGSGDGEGGEHDDSGSDGDDD